MEKQTISRKLPTEFKLAALASAVLAAFVAPLQANINVPPKSALLIDGGHVVVNDDDTNKNGIWDKSEEVTIDNKGLEGPKPTAKPEPVLRQFSFKPTWSGSPGKLVITQSNSSTPPTPSTPPLPDPNIKLWKDPEKKEQFTLAASYDVTSKADPIIFWVEGIEPTDTFDTLKFTAVYTFTNPTSKLSATATGTIAFGVTQADLDIDSNNQSGTNATGYDDTEDKIEFSFKEEHPGKILLETRNDVDSDGVIDSVDGISELPGTGGTPTVAGLKLVPMRLTLKKPFTTANAKVKFSYRASVPRIEEGITADQDAEGKPIYRITTPGIRLWTKDGDERTSGKDVGGTEGGDFIPANTEINWQDLQPESGATTKIIYVEYVDVEGSAKQFSKEDIVVEISDDTSSAKGYIQYNGGEKKPLLGTKSPDGVNAVLLPVEIVPDYNRDGMIDQMDRGKVTTNDPWRWWINDDKDNGDYSADEESVVSGQADGNFSDDSINGVSDLTDFFPIFLDIKKLLQVLPPGEYDYKLSQAEGALNFAEAPELIPDDDPDYDGAGAFWRSAFWAENYKNLPVQQITPSGVSLSNSILDQLKKGHGILLMEYRKASEAPLELEIWKGSQKFTTITFHSKAGKVEEMYRHLNLYEATGTQSSQLNDTGEPDNYPDDKTNDKAFVMIHGYSPRGNGAKNDRIQRGFQSVVFRRLHQAGSKAKYVAVYWDSATGMDYHKATYQAFKTSPFVGQRLGFLAGNEITVGAHSLGNIVTSNAVCHEGFRPENYFLINAASPIEAYNPTQTQVGNVLMKTAMTERKWKPYDERFHSPNWHARFPANDNRRKLKWKGRFSSIADHTKPFNFYSTGEDVVANPEPGEDDFDLFRKIWKRIGESEALKRYSWVGQEFVKGGTSVAAGIAFERNHGGWEFNGRNQELRFMVEQDPLDPLGTYRIPLPNTANQRLNNGIIAEEHLAQFGLFKRFESPAYDALYAPINDANKNWTDAAGFAWQNPHTRAQGSALAGQKDTQWLILASAMPSVSFAAAANAVDDIDGFNMNRIENKNGWPAMPERKEYLNDWQHSDFASPGVAATFTKKMYEKMVKEGELNE